MREWVLLEFLAGRVGASVLRRDLRGDAPAAPPVPPSPEYLELELLPRHLLRLCDAVLDRELDAALLAPIASRLRSSARFGRSRQDPDRRGVGEVLEAWSSTGRGPIDRATVLIYPPWYV